MYKENSNLIAASAWMVGIAMVLFFMPAVNGLIGGAVGGYKAGTPGRAITAALIPAVVLAAGMWLIFAVSGAPLWGFFAGASIALLILFAELGLLVGALIGGWMAQTRSRRLIV